MLIDNTIYGYAVARVKAMETRLLDQGHFERMVNSSDSGEALKILSETGYSAALAELDDVYNFEAVLGEELSYTFNTVLKISPIPEMIASLVLRYDIHNLKVLFKAKFLGIKSDLLIPVGSIELSKLEHAVNEDNYLFLPGKLRQAANNINDDFMLNRDPQIIDLLLDQVLYEQLIDSAREYESEFLEGLFTRQIDLNNLKTLLRIKRMGLNRDFLARVLLPNGSIALNKLTAMIEEPEESLISMLALSDYADLVNEGVREWTEKGSASLLEKLSDNFITAYLRESKWVPFGIEPLVGYLWAKEIEIKNIRIVLVGKINKLPAESIRERMRDVYI